MRFLSLTACALAGMLSSYSVQPLAAQTAEQLTFIPSGGRTLLTDVAAAKPPASAGEVKPLLTGKHSRDEWSSYLTAHSQAVPTLQQMSDKQRLTLADYLAFHMPLPANQIPENPAANTAWTRTLPKDGRDLALANCQGCHIITVVVTQQRTKVAWLGTLSTPSHAVIKFTAAERDELASYLELNGGIPIEQVPEDLRASGATY